MRIRDHDLVSPLHLRFFDRIFYEVGPRSVDNGQDKFSPCESLAHIGEAGQYLFVVFQGCIDIIYAQFGLVGHVDLSNFVVDEDLLVAIENLLHQSQYTPVLIWQK